MSYDRPIVRDTRRRDIAAAEGQTVFTFDRPLFDAADLGVYVKVAPASGFTRMLTGYTVDPSPGLDNATVTFAVAPRPAGAPVTVVRLQGERIAERMLDVTRGGTVRSVAIEDELDRVNLVLQEVRRDVDDVHDVLIFVGDVYALLPITRGQALLALRNNTTAGINWLTAVQSALPADESDISNIRFSDAFWPAGGAAWTFVATVLDAALPGGFSPSQLAALQKQAMDFKGLP